MDCSSPERPPAPRWIKAWVPQPLVASGGKCSLLKWIREDTLEDLEPKETKVESTTEVLFLCSYGGCGKTFIDAADIRKHAAIHVERKHAHTHGERKHAHTHGERKHAHTHGERKHAHTHGERKHAAVHGERKHPHTHGERKHAHTHGEKQNVCQYEGCGKRFADSSKLKRHFLIHTGEKPFKCSFEGCGKPFALDFNLKVHMKTHFPENYHICSYPECGKRFTNESKLNSHIKAHQQKNMAVKNTPAATKHNNVPKTYSAANYRSVSVARPYACPHEGCSKAYIYEYKLDLHLRSTHAVAVEDPSATNHAIVQGAHVMTSEDDSEGSFENAEVGRWR